MGDNEINQFDNLIRQQMDGFKPTPPQGVWAGVEQAVSGNVAKGILSKGLVKLIIAAVTTTAVITTVVILTNKSPENKQEQISQNNNQPLVNEGNKAETTSKSGPGESNIKETQPAQVIASETGESKNQSSGRATENGASSKKSSSNAGNNGETNSFSQGNSSKGDRNTSPNNIKNFGSQPSNKTYTLNTPTQVCPGQRFYVEISPAPEKEELYILINDGSGAHGIIDGKGYTCQLHNEGNYTIQLENQQGKVLTSKEVKVMALQAAFQYNLQLYPDVRFTANGGEEAEYTWSFGDEDAATGKDVMHRYIVPRDSQNYTVKLIAWNASGCRAESSLPITLYAAEEPIIPNVFTPDGDLMNDKFEILMRGNKLIMLQVYDQDQHLLFESTDPANQWDGTSNGRLVEKGTYYYHLTYQSKAMDKIQTIRNIIMLQRGN